MPHFAVIDTETNWNDRVMSIGAVIAEEDTLRAVDAKYLVLPAECAVGGMYEGALFAETPVPPERAPRDEALRGLCLWFHRHGIRDIFAYNAAFDRDRLPELRAFAWHDIMQRAAYRQTNPKIPSYADCCATGRLRRGYGVEPMLRLLSGDRTYCETHNAILDAFDELEIMRLLGAHPREYV